MITDVEISSLAMKHGITLMGVNPETFHDSRAEFARELYQLGRQHQRESDAALCEKLANSTYDFERPNAEVKCCR